MIKAIHSGENFKALCALSRHELAYVYCMSRASNAGERIVIQQYDRDGIAIRELLETLMDAPFPGLVEYYREVCANNGVFRRLRNKEWIKPTFTRGALETACADRDITPPTHIVDRLFTPTTFREVCNYGKSPERWTLDGTPYKKAYRAELAHIKHWLECARTIVNRNPEFWSPLHSMCITELIQFLTTFSESDYNTFISTWVSYADHTDFSLDWMIGYDDPLGIQDTFASDVTIEALSMEKYMSNIREIQCLLPVPSEQLHTQINTPTISVRYRITGSGMFGAMYQVCGYSHPETSGDDTLTTREITYYNHIPPSHNRYSAVSDADSALVNAHLRSLDTVLTILHESGHTFGCQRKPIETPEFDALEELRAELTAWYLGTHPDMAKYDLWSFDTHADQVRAVNIYMAFVSPHNWLKHGADTDDEHVIADTIIFNHLHNRGAITLHQDRLEFDHPAIQREIHTLLVQVYDIYYRGDADACRKIVQTGHPDPAQVEIVRNMAKSHVPHDIVTVAPKLTPVYDEDGLQHCKVARFRDDIEMHRWNWSIYGHLK